MSTSLFLYLIQFDVNNFCHRLYVLCTQYTEENKVFFYYWNKHAHYEKPRLHAMASKKESHLFLTFTAWNKVKSRIGLSFFSLLKVKKQVFMFVSFSINNIVIQNSSRESLQIIQTPWKVYRKVPKVTTPRKYGEPPKVGKKCHSLTKLSSNIRK